jgi:HrpA-like RNA helicase
MDKWFHTEILLLFVLSNILVFLTTEYEIHEAISILAQHNEDFMLLPFYSKQNDSDQQRVFEVSDKPKIIFATNIAESSLTIPGVEIVVDCGHFLSKTFVRGCFTVEKKLISKNR